MRKCTGNNTDQWGFDAIFEVTCPHCDYPVEFFKDEINRNCPQCRGVVVNNRRDYGCNRWCSSFEDASIRNTCPNFRRSKDRFWRGYRSI